ncbi:MAG TPA: fluoride efflux transporter CrcB [Firmicutes bacterium]|nr:fluoride efflux transporter CrcB [Bacillota bacterium]
MALKLFMLMLGGGAGAASRYFVTHFINNTYYGHALSSWGTLAVNLTGSFLLGIIFYMFQSAPHLNHIYLFLAVGFCGAFTTFSTYALEIHNQLSAGLYKEAAISLLLNNIGCVAFVFAGIYLAKLAKGLLRGVL